MYPSPEAGHLSQFRVLLGDRILEANQKIVSTTKEVKLVSGALTVETPRKPDLDRPEDLGDYTSTTNSGVYRVRLPIRFLKINDDVAIWSAPLELFREISNEVRDQSPINYTLYLGLKSCWGPYAESN